MGEHTSSSPDDVGTGNDRRAECSCCWRRWSDRTGRQEAPASRRFDGYGIPCSAAAGRRDALCVSWSFEKGRVPLSSVWKQDVRGADRLRGMRVDGRVQSTSGAKVSPSSPHPVVSGIDNSFWFLFPVSNYGVFGIPQAIEEEAENNLSPNCFGCDKPFPTVSTIPCPVAYHDRSSSPLIVAGQHGYKRRRERRRRDDQSHQPISMRKVRQRFLHGMRSVRPPHHPHLSWVFAVE